MSKIYGTPVVTPISPAIIGGGGGANGKSAYELAVSEGFEGTLTEWLESLHGGPGPKGPTPIKGVDYLTDAEIEAVAEQIAENISPEMVGAMPIYKGSLSNCSENDVLEAGGYAIAAANATSVTDGVPELAAYARFLIVLNADNINARIIQLECRSSSSVDLSKNSADLFYRIIINGTTKTIQPWRRIGNADDFLSLAGGTMAGNLNMGGKKLTGLSEPVNNADAATKSYVDSKEVVTGVAYDTFCATKYVDCTTTDTVQDGTYAHPFKTMDQFFDYCNKSGRLEFWCMILSVGTYTISKTQFAGGSFHIYGHETLSRDDVKLVFERDDWATGIVSFYGTHYNFKNVTLINTSDADANSGFSFETCVVGLKGCRVVGKNIRFTQCYLSISPFAKPDGTSNQTYLTNLICSGCNGHIDDLVIVNYSAVNTNKLLPINISAGSHIQFVGSLTLPSAPTEGISIGLRCTGSTIAFDNNGDTSQKIKLASTGNKYTQGIHAKTSTVFLPASYASDLATIAVTATYNGYALPNLWVNNTQSV